MKPTRLIGVSAALLFMAGVAGAQTLNFKGTTLGSPSLPGSWTGNAQLSGTTTVVGGGADIWGTSDNGYYVYSWVSGNLWEAQITVANMVFGPTADAWAKAELMVRESDPTAGPQGGDAFIANMVTEPTGEDEVGPQFRTANAGSADRCGGVDIQSPITLPMTVKMIRVGSVFTLISSTNGVNWNTNGVFDTSSSAALPSTDNGTSFGTPFTNTLALGIAVTSHDDTDVTGETVTLTNFQFAPITPTAPTAMGAVVQVKNQTNVFGSEVSFSFATTNNAVPDVLENAAFVSYQWYKNGAALPGATGTDLTFLTTQPDNGAQVYCVASLAAPYNTKVQSLTSATGLVSVASGAVYYTNGLKMEFFANQTARTNLETGNLPPATYVTMFPNLDQPATGIDNFVNRVSGWFKPPTTDSYVFFLATDDDSDLWLSTDETPANKRIIAQENTWSGQDSWLNSGDGDAGNTMQVRSDQWSPDESGMAAYPNGIALTAGKLYYIEVDHHQGGGGDDLSVTYQTETMMNNADWISVFTNGTPSLMQGSSGCLVFVTDKATYINWSLQPTNISTIQAKSVTFTASAYSDSELQLQYQWYKNGAIITNATSTSYSLTLILADNGEKYTLVASTQVGGIVSTSSVATLTVQTGVWEAGFAKCVQYLQLVSQNIASVESLTNPIAYTLAEPAFEVRTDNGSEDNYDGDIITGFFVPQTSGSYVFFVNSDDQADLFLSTDGNPSDKTMIAQETAWSNPWQWTVSNGGGPAGQKRSDQWTNSVGVVLYENGISLVAGQKYYLEADHYNGGGGDNVEVTVKKTTDADPANGADTILKGNLIGFYAPPCSYVAFTQEPANATAQPFTWVTFSAAGNTDSQIAVAPNTQTPDNYRNNFMFFQWQVNGQNVAGANASSYILEATPWNSGAQVSCQMRAIGYADANLNPIWSNSTPATLTVIAPTSAPTVTYASFYTNNNGISGAEATVAVAFSNPMDPASLLKGTYTVSGGVTVSQVLVNSNNYSGVLLVLSGFPSLPATVNVSNVKDAWGQALSTAQNSASAALFPLINQDIGQPGSDPVVPGMMYVQGSNAFTIQCEGSDIWNISDGFNFSYMAKTGNFDMVVRQKTTTHTSNYSKAGLMLREWVNNGGIIDNAARNWNVVNVPLSSDGIQAPDNSGGGANTIECNCRDEEGVTAHAWPNVATMDPDYPNAWLRLTRTNNILTAFASTNEYDWVKLSTIDASTNTVDTTVAALPATVYVGVCCTAHNNDAVDTPWTQLLYLYSAQFDNFTADFVQPAQKIPNPATLTYKVSGQNITLSWTPAGGTLWSSPTLGPGATWQTVGTANPATVPITGKAQFFRVSNP